MWQGSVGFLPYFSLFFSSVALGFYETEEDEV